MASGFSYGGVTTRRPTVRTIVDDKALTPIPIGVIQTVALIGTAEGGEPKVPEWFSSPTDAAARLRAGDLYDANRLVFGPSPEGLGPQRVVYVRVNPATRATKTIQDATPANAIDLTSVNYGVRDNGIAIKVETGTTAGSKKITVTDGVVNYVKDNLKRNVLSIQYTGAGSAATLTVNGTTLSTSVTGGPGSENLSITLATYATVKKLVDYINSLGLPYTVTLLDPNPDNPTPSTLDFVTAQAIKASAYTVTATLDEILRWLNAGAQPLLTAARSSGAGLPPNNTTGFVYLAGGSEGSATDNDWQAALDALYAEDVGYVVVLSSSSTHQGYLLSHVNTASVNGQKLRRGFIGAALGQKNTNLTNYTAIADSMNSDRIALLVQGITIKKEDDSSVTLAPYFTAAMAAGLQAGLNLGDSLTRRSVLALGIEWVPTDAEAEIAVERGLLLIERIQNRGGFRFTRGISTWRADDKFNRVEISTGVAVDEVRRRSTAVAETFIGQKVTAVLGYQILSAIQTMLFDLMNQDIIVSYPNGQPWQGNKATVQGDTIYIEFTIQPIIPLNFIGIKVVAKPFSGTFTVALQ